MSSTRKKATPVAKGPSMVTLAIQLVDGQRLIHDFAPETSLWNILQHFEAQQCLKPSLSSCGNEVPLCIYLRQEVLGQEKLEKTSLLELGISGGKVVIRYLQKSLDSQREQAHVGGILLPTPRPASPGPEQYRPEEIAPVTEPMEVVETPDIAKENVLQGHFEEPSLVTNAEQATAIKVSKPSEEVREEVAAVTESAQVNVPVTAPEAIKKSEYIESLPATKPSPPLIKKRARLEVDERRIPLNSRGDLVYSQEEAALSADIRPAESDLADDFYELTVDDLRLLLRDLKKQYTEPESPLLTAEMRRSREERRFHEIAERYPITVLRVQFPDRLILQIPFQSESTIAIVKEALLEYLEGNLQMDDFYLYTSPPKKIIDLDVSLLRGGLTPSAVVYISSERVSCRIKEEFRNKQSSYFGAMRDATERLSLGESKPRTAKEEVKNVAFGLAAPRTSQASPAEGQDGDQSEDHGTQRAVQTSGPVPKWFKMKK